jgi:hypothetical protein
MPRTAKHIRVTVDESIYGDVVAELHLRGCLIESMEDEGANKVIGAGVQGLDIEDFAFWLGALSGGRGRVVELPLPL